MRSESEIQSRIRFLLTQEIRRRVAETQERLPHRCIYNVRHALDVRKTIRGEPNTEYNRLEGRSLPVVGLCMYGAEDPQTWPGKICEEPMDAIQSEFFKPRVTPEQVQEEFEKQIQDLNWVAQNLPEVYGLLWALGSDSAPQLPWWKRLLYWVLRIRPDALVPSRALPVGK